MTKAEKLKLHKTLTAIVTKLTAIEAGQKIMGTMLDNVEKDIRNLFHVVEETQRQQRASSPTLRVIKSGQGTKTPRPSR